MAVLAKIKAFFRGTKPTAEAAKKEAPQTPEKGS
jgi:hypothetical protein